MDEDDQIVADQVVVESVTPAAPAMFNSVEIMATNVLSAYPTCPPIMTEVKVGDKKVKFECDTAASHNVLSQETYQDIWKRGSGPKLEYHSVKVMLADGTRSQKQTRSMEAVVEAANGKQVKLQFFVMSGPNNLLGRLALKTLWPEQYAALKDVAEVPIRKAAVTVVKKAKVKSQSGSVYRPVVARASADLGQQFSTPVTAGAALPERRKLPPPPTGVVTQKQGEDYCRLICQQYPEVFDGKKGQFKGAQAQLFVKDGHWDLLKKTGIRPPAKVPYGLQEQYDKKLDDLLQHCTPVNGQDIFVASQIVPVCEVKNGEKVLKRLAINYKSTINDHLEDIPQVPTVCSDEIDKLKGQYRSVIDMTGAFQQIPMAPGLSRDIFRHCYS